jgi:hypothetical protein
MRDTGIIRVIQSVTAGLQAALAVAGIANIMGPKVVLIGVVIVAGLQGGVATWNQGLHNQPVKAPDLKY